MERVSGRGNASPRARADMSQQAPVRVRRQHIPAPDRALGLGLVLTCGPMQQMGAYTGDRGSPLSQIGTAFRGSFASRKSLIWSPFY